MTTAQLAHDYIPGSRPKVGRLPKLPPAAQACPPRARLRNTGFYFMVWLGLFAALFAGSLLIKRSSSISLQAIEVPPVVVTPSSSFADSGLPGAISDAQAAALTEKSSNTILLQDKGSMIIGQMAKIPAENEHITEVKPGSDIDNNTGRELLSIVSKY
jgi:hypothetical protein